VAVLALHLFALRLLTQLTAAPPSPVADAFMMELAPAPAAQPPQPTLTPAPPAAAPLLQPPPPTPTPQAQTPPPPPEGVSPSPPEPPSPIAQAAIPDPPIAEPLVTEPPVPDPPVPLPQIHPTAHPAVPTPPRPRIVHTMPRPPRLPPKETVAEAPQPMAPVASAQGSTPAAPRPSAATSAAAAATWQSRLLAHLEQFKRFPVAAQRRGEQGVVSMRFRMDHAGHVLSATMTRSSGYADLDAEAQAWIQRADPMPALPAEMTEQVMELSVPLRFDLH
jgi:protein TonB